MDFVDFYSLDRSTTPNANDNRPPPNFQIQFRRVNRLGDERLNDLEIAFAYLDSFSSGGNRVPQDAAIGY